MLSDSFIFDLVNVLPHASFKDAQTGKYIWANDETATYCRLSSPAQMVGLTVGDFGFFQTRLSKTYAIQTQEMDRWVREQRRGTTTTRTVLRFEDDNLTYETVAKLPIFGEKNLLGIVTFGHNLTAELSLRSLYSLYEKMFERKDAIDRFLRHVGIDSCFFVAPTHLICYVGGTNTQINRDDIIGLVDLLHNVPEGKPVDLLLHTCGGDVDACEKLVGLIHAKVIESPFRVIIPDMAKSAGTLLALGASTIVMSDTSELGMIDPQYQLRDDQGNELWHSVIAYVEAYTEYANALAKDPKDPVALLMLHNFDAKVVHKFKGIRDRVRTFAEDLLKRQGLPASTISTELMSSSRWKTHGQPIMHADAAQLGLPVEYLPTDDERWIRYWRLYCLQRLEIEDDKKIFESVFVSQVFER